MAGRFVQGNELDVPAMDPLTEISDFGQRQDSVAVSTGGHVVD